MAIEYLQWLCEARGIAATTEAFQLRSLIAIAKWLHPPHANGARVEKYERPVVMELVRVQRGSKTLAAKGSHAADEAAKWLDWPDYLRLVETLKLECAPLTHARRPDARTATSRWPCNATFSSPFSRACRTGSAPCASSSSAARSSAKRRMRWPRQRSRNRNRNRRGAVTAVDRPHAPEDYKTGGAYGARPALVLDPRLYPALEAWLFGPRGRRRPFGSRLGAYSTGATARRWRRTIAWCSRARTASRGR